MRFSKRRFISCFYFIAWLTIWTFVTTLGVSCKKSWLDAKPQKALVVPATIQDFQALLDNTADASYADFNADQNGLGEVSAGDFYVSDGSWSSAPVVDKNALVWAPDIYEGSTNISDWSTPYKKIFYTNIVIEGINKIEPNINEQKLWDQVKGGALFYRAFNHFDVAQEFCKEYNANSAMTDIGIPIRVTSNFNVTSTRLSVQQTYDQIIEDLKTAEELLPNSTPIFGADTVLYRLRPTKVAANAMLARVYLFMSDYDNALKYSDKCLQIYSTLLNYNTDINPPAGSTITGRFNKEVIFHSRISQKSIFLNSRLIVDSNLYQSYLANDLRKTAFYTFSGIAKYKGSYDGSATALFGGLATDEIYLIRSECYARKGNINAAMQDLNALLSKRWKSGTFTNIIASDINDALAKILLERRKELCFRALRWPDLKRLNKDMKFPFTISRYQNGRSYSLPPNDPKYLLPIPSSVITLSGISQNPR